MEEMAGSYATGMPSALGIGHETMIKRFHNTELLTLGDLLTTADITETEIDIVIKVAIAY